jgi:curli biogenesis system outer membrane secretion channel CsgG
MTNRRISTLVTTALVAAPTIFAVTATAYEHSGTWKLNPAKSKYSPGPAPKNPTETIQLDENSYKVEGNGTAGDVKLMHLEFDAKFDGKDQPIRGVPWADMQSARWLDAHTPQLVQKKGGQVMMTVTCKVSTDGKTRTCTMKGKDEQGHKVNNVVVFDRQ